MRFSSIWSVLTAQAALTATAQPIGRYVYYDPRAYMLAVDIHENKVAFVQFLANGKTFQDGPYSLVEHDPATYSLDFSGTIEGVHNLYMGIDAVYPNLTPEAGDLETLIRLDRDHIRVGLAGQMLVLSRYGFRFVEGTFKYVRPSPPLSLEYDIRADGNVYLQIECSHKTPKMTYRLQENEHGLPYRSYDVISTGSSPPLPDTLKRFCPHENLNRINLTRVVFVTHNTAYIGSEGAFLPFTKV